MSLKSCLEKIEHFERRWGGKSHSRKWLKKVRNRWMRRFKKTDIPQTKRYVGWEY